MSYTKHIQYNDTGEILSIRNEETSIFNKRVAAGEKVIPADITDGRLYKVDVTTQQLIEKTKEELEAEGITVVPFVDLSLSAG